MLRVRVALSHTNILISLNEQRALIVSDICSKDLYYYTEVHCTVSIAAGF